MQDRIDTGPSIEDVLKSTKTGLRAYDESSAENARNLVRMLYDEVGNERVTAKVLGVSQTTVNRLRRAGSTMQPTLVVLLALREHYRMSIDQILGLAPIAPIDFASIGELRARLRDLLTTIDTVGGGPPVHRGHRG